MSYGNSNTDYYSDDKNLSDYEKAPFEGCGDFFNTPVKNSQSHSSSQPLPGDLYSSYRRTPHKSPPDHFSHSSRPPPEMAEDPYRDFYEANALTSATPTWRVFFLQINHRQGIGTWRSLSENHLSGITRQWNIPAPQDTRMLAIPTLDIKRLQFQMMMSPLPQTKGRIVGIVFLLRSGSPPVRNIFTFSDRYSHNCFLDMSVSPRPPVSSAYSTSSASHTGLEYQSRTNSRAKSVRRNRRTKGWFTFPKHHRRQEVVFFIRYMLSISDNFFRTRVPDYTPFYRKTREVVLLGIWSQNPDAKC